MNILIDATLDAYTSLSTLQKQDINIVYGLPEAKDAIAKALYVDTLENQLAITLDNISWLTMYPGFVGDFSEGSQFNPDKLVNLRILNSSISQLYERVKSEMNAEWVDFYSSMLLLQCGDSTFPFLS